MFPRTSDALPRPEAPVPPRVPRIPLRRTLIDMPMRIAGETIVMHVDLVITGVNRPVAIPSVGSVG